MIGSAVTGSGAARGQAGASHGNQPRHLRGPPALRCDWVCALKALDARCRIGRLNRSWWQVSLPPAPLACPSTFSDLSDQGGVPHRLRLPAPTRTHTTTPLFPISEHGPPAIRLGFLVVASSKPRELLLRGSPEWINRAAGSHMHDHLTPPHPSPPLLPAAPAEDNMSFIARKYIACRRRTRLDK